MDIHEYQAKQILHTEGINIPKGKIAYTPTEARNVASAISNAPWIIKAQVHSGARSKGHFLDSKSGKRSGIRQVATLKDVYKNASQMLGSTLVTPQSPNGNYVSRIYVEEYIPVEKNFYLSMGIDRTKSSIILLAANTDIDDISKLAAKKSEKIFRLPIDDQGPNKEQAAQIAQFLNLETKLQPDFYKFIKGMHKTFIDNDALMLEINPAGIANKKIIALDAKIILDEKGLYRHQDNLRLKDDDNLTPSVIKAARYGFSYQEYDGNLGCIVNGEGLSWAMKDLIDSPNVSLGSVLNVKGGVDRDKIAAGIKIIASNPKVDGIVINILGGFLRCDLIADGIIDAAAEVGLNVPLVARFEGTNRAKAINILTNSGLPIIMADSTQNAIEKIIKAVEENG
ncbi:MAG: succinate--CoA ligase subunit beta [Alphaproteobacteria bacterium]|nr:succinate--CoA ligase subunit beta [Alphaproteobacteria bacterium]